MDVFTEFPSMVLVPMNSSSSTLLLWICILPLGIEILYGYSSINFIFLSHNFIVFIVSLVRYLLLFSLYHQCLRSYHFSFQRLSAWRSIESVDRCTFTLSHISVEWLPISNMLCYLIMMVSCSHNMFSSCKIISRMLETWRVALHSQ